MDLTLSNQTATKDEVAPKILALKTEMDKRKEVWTKLSPDQKKKWIASGKDPVMDLAWNIYKYLHNNFFEGEGTNG